MKFPIHITASSLVSSMGNGKSAHLSALKAHRTGLKNTIDSLNPRLDSFYGEVSGVTEVALPQSLQDYHCRNNQLAWLALQSDGFIEAVEAAKHKYGATRIGLAVGTSTSGILETEQAWPHKNAEGEFETDYHYETTHRMNSLADFCADALEIYGPRIVISTACSSSAKVFASASRWIDHGLVDAVIVGGVDTLCLTTIHGFNALGLVNPDIVKPLNCDRKGINIGEAGGFMLLEKSDNNVSNIQLSGFGESSDAYHISTPHPQGLGAKIAMEDALKMAELNSAEIDYLNLHGTGTQSNDLAEAHAVNDLFGENQPMLSSTKGFTGHTLGAAGITEAVFCQLALENQLAFPNLNLESLDPELNLNPIIETTESEIRHCMSNSFGFGGNNACLIFSLAQNAGGESR
ncbi:beta-ketoacyl-[acyl-carrier-protein] synthase family protein [Thiomicrorhabdus sp. ZW0627]|uniref:beta-ketoacyl-[acyl-carrier-protein] synthase family protein n=1 Tax=Thiomicrorhabdus sp. ZW0627 TaxID=3039774 RepID=UPI0024372E2C|nr:beta-ketoacyl-[acyl-carrier-protein] synthase family protein [Thiomicrorhabdus sp. ZW0627]MDG6774333.1 beta-ketoacyl-[acyl-carrier-protein] synthase family protein [Thiomicrorhabdus sp. ZW0627]